jgi:hypothetical protein
MRKRDTEGLFFDVSCRGTHMGHTRDTQGSHRGILFRDGLRVFCCCVMFFTCPCAASHVCLVLCRGTHMRHTRDTQGHPLQGRLHGSLLLCHVFQTCLCAASHGCLVPAHYR